MRSRSTQRQYCSAGLTFHYSPLSPPCRICTSYRPSWQEGTYKIIGNNHLYNFWLEKMDSFLLLDWAFIWKLKLLTSLKRWNNHHHLFYHTHCLKASQSLAGVRRVLSIEFSRNHGNLNLCLLSPQKIWSIHLSQSGNSTKFTRNRKLFHHLQHRVWIDHQGLFTDNHHIWRITCEVCCRRHYQVSRSSRSSHPWSESDPQLSLSRWTLFLWRHGALSTPPCS